MSLFASCFKENCCLGVFFFSSFCGNNKQFLAQSAFSLPHQDAVGQKHSAITFNTNCFTPETFVAQDIKVILKFLALSNEVSSEIWSYS